MEVIDLKGHVLLPGLVNTHHHLYQHLTRVVPAAQDGNVWNWLKVLYPMWARMQPDDVWFAHSVHVNDAEIAVYARTGCGVAHCPCSNMPDFFAVNLNRVGFAGGSMIDPVASVLFGAPVTADYTVVNGRTIVKDGRITTLDLPKVIAQCNRAAMRVVNG